jgi:predicted metalloprotease with PDZ domain
MLIVFRARTRMVVVVLALFGAMSADAQTAPEPPVSYRVSFPAPEHRWMQVEATFPSVPPGPLQVRMSRTSPGRYALHEFAKNVFDVQVRDGKGAALTPMRPNLHQWDVDGHDGTVVVTYRVYGDRTDGTYLSVDSAHAHINMPAALMWARGLQTRSARVTFELPAGRQWRVATQLLPTGDPQTFTAPNLQYLMDSPTELSAFTLRTFTLEKSTGGENGAGNGAPTFRIALHHDGSDAEADDFSRDVQRIVREELQIFRELPRYESGSYTFLSDYLPWANGDGMEHRNSTVLSGNGALGNPAQRKGMLGTVAHEFFHSWNMERIRSRALEPFDFEEADVSGELWLGEGFTSYYDNLVMHRTGLQPLEDTLADFSRVINAVVLSPGRRIRSAEDMSRLAPFVDAAVSIDRTAWPNLFISYYTWGSAIGLGLDLSLRDRSDGRVTLDDFMRAMWTVHGAPGQKEPGLVATPYTMDDIEKRLAEVSGNREFAADFMKRYAQGHEVPDYARLLGRAGLIVRPRAAGKASVEGASLTFTGAGAARVSGPVMLDSPLYKAGLEQDDQLMSLDGTVIASQQALDEVLTRHKPGDRVSVRFVRRSGQTVDATLTLEEDPRIEVVAVEQNGGTLSAEQRRFRDDWLGSKMK